MVLALVVQKTPETLWIEDSHRDRRFEISQEIEQRQWVSAADLAV